MVVGCVAIIFFGQIYRLAPGWNPIIKYDADASEDLTIRQHLISQHIDSLRNPPQPRGGLWDKDPGTVVEHPTYGSVIVRNKWMERQQQRDADPAAPRLQRTRSPLPTRVTPAAPSCTHKNIALHVMTIALDERADPAQPSPVALDVEAGQPCEVKTSHISDFDESPSPSKKDAVIEKRKATFFASFVTLGMSTMGIGILNLPQNFSLAGKVPGTIFVVLCAFATVLSLIIMVRVAKRTGLYAYEGLSTYYLGFWGTVLTNWSLLIQLALVVIAFLSIPMNTGKELLYTGEEVCTTGSSFSLPSCVKDADCAAGQGCFFKGMALNSEACVDDSSKCFCGKVAKWYSHEYFIGFLVSLLIGFTGLATTLEKVSPMATVAFFCLSTAIVLLFVIFLQDLAIAKEETPESGGIMDVLTMVGNLVLAYQCQYNVLQCYHEMKVPKNIDKLIYLSIFGVACPLYMFVAWIGLYVVPAGGTFKGNIFDSLGDNPIAQGAKWLCVIMAICKTPLVFSPTRDLLISELRRIPYFSFITLHNFTHRAVLSFLLITTCYFFAWFLPLGALLAIAGAVCAAPSAFIIPGLYFLRDCNMHGLRDATKEQLSGLAGFLPQWKRYTPEAKKNYILGVICFMVGLIGSILATVGVVVLLTQKGGQPKIASCETSA